jgi:hypothetical protein
VIFDNAPPSESPDANQLHLFSIFAISKDLAESKIVYIMAVDELSAAFLFHKARARDYSNEPQELIINFLSHANDCDG